MDFVIGSGKIFQEAIGICEYPNKQAYMLKLVIQTIMFSLNELP